MRVEMNHHAYAHMEISLEELHERAQHLSCVVNRLLGYSVNDVNISAFHNAFLSSIKADLPLDPNYCNNLATVGLIDGPNDGWSTRALILSPDVLVDHVINQTGGDNKIILIYFMAMYTFLSNSEIITGVQCALENSNLTSTKLAKLDFQRIISYDSKTKNHTVYYLTPMIVIGGTIKERSGDSRTSGQFVYRCSDSYVLQPSHHISRTRFCLWSEHDLDIFKKEFVKELSCDILALTVSDFCFDSTQHFFFDYRHDDRELHSRASINELFVKKKPGKECGISYNLSIHPPSI